MDYVSFYWITGINPEPWAIGTPYRRGSKGLGISPNGKVKSYQDAVREEITLQNGHVKMHEGELAVTFYFWRTSNVRGQVADASNMSKSTEDALQDILYGNDRVNRDVRGVIMEQSPETKPHILIVVKPFVLPVIVPPPEVLAPKWAGSDWQEPEEEMF